MQETSIGTVEIVALVDNVMPYGGALVYPHAGEKLNAYKHLLDGNGAVALAFASFLVRDGSSTVLVDTGWGPEYQGKLLDELAAAGVSPAEVDTVIFTHLHGDHTGWNIDRATGKPIFGRARYLAPKADWDHYRAQDPQPGSFVRDMLPLEAEGRLEMVDGEHRLSPSLTAVPTPGHTPGHTSVAILSGGAHGYILGDVVISPIDALEPSFENSFDWDHGIAEKTRRRVMAELAERRALVGASHLPAPGLGRFAAKGAGFEWQPL